MSDGMTREQEFVESPAKVARGRKKREALEKAAAAKAAKVRKAAQTVEAARLVAEAAKLGSEDGGRDALEKASSDASDASESDPAGKLSEDEE